MDTVKIKLLKYAFGFKPLSWREEFDIKYLPKQDRRRTQLAYALDEISGFKISSPAEAIKVMNAIPLSVISRVFILYRAAFPEPRIFSTVGLYKAPEPNKVVRKFEEVEEEREEIMDKVEREMEAKFGRKELLEQRERERELLRNSGLKGATKPTPDREK